MSIKLNRWLPLRIALLTLTLIAAAPSRADIDIHIDVRPELVPVPGYPVYYASNLAVNYFFYDGAYWLYYNDRWYVSEWHDGPWQYVDPFDVPDFLLRVPVRYYRRPPVYFHAWHYDAAPRWGYHWGPSWERRRPHWNRWDHRHVPPRAPLPRHQHQRQLHQQQQWQRQRQHEQRQHQQQRQHEQRREQQQHQHQHRLQGRQQHPHWQQQRREQQRPNVQRRDPDRLQQRYQGERRGEGNHRREQVKPHHRPQQERRQWQGREQHGGRSN